MKYILFVFAFNIVFMSYSQKLSKEERQEMLDKRKLNKGAYETDNGYVFAVGDTITIESNTSYNYVFKNRGLSMTPLKHKLSETKCIIKSIKNSFGEMMANCKASSGYYSVMLEGASIYEEIIISKEKKDQAFEKQIKKRKKLDNYEGFSFQTLNWSSTKEDIIKLFPNIKILDNILSIDTNLGTYSTNLFFNFENQELELIGYSFEEKHSNDNLYIDDYKEIKSLLIEKYGPPELDKMNWSDDLYKKQYSQYGFAVSLGHLEYYCKWELPDTDIVLKLTGDNYEISHLLGYMRFPKLNMYSSKKEMLKKL